MIDIQKVREQAVLEVEQEKFIHAVEKEKTKLKWPWYKRLFPYRIQIKVVDLRKKST